MHLKSIEISNFRSIKFSTVNFDHNCKILVGINESGKTSILKAISLIHPDEKLNKNDIRIPLPDENPIEVSRAMFIFEFTKSELEEIKKQIKSRILINDKSSILRKRGKDFTLKSIIQSNTKGLYVTDLYIGKKDSSYYGMLYDSIPNTIKKISSNCPPEIVTQVNGENTKLNKYEFVDTTITEVSDKYLEEASTKDITQLIGTEIAHCVDNNLPNTICWRYSDKYLLPPDINTVEFLASPEICVPLKCMFELSNINDINKSFSEYKERYPHGVTNLLNKVAENCTKHFKKVWQEYGHIEFILQENGDKISIAIKDNKTHFEMDSRSDGFKRFTTFLLIISSRVATKNINNALIIIDEPDTSLHPSGIKHLLKELLAISKSNNVIFSTHSPYMIDDKEIDRHLIIEKNKEVTLIKNVDHSNIKDEEVIYNALGTSLFENFKQLNLLFEGWRDKALFKIVFEKILKSKDKVFFEQFGHCFIKGVKSAEHIAPLLELGHRDYIIISDSDDVALREQSNFLTGNYSGRWWTYADIDPTCTAMTGEDFIEEKFYIKQVKRTIKDSFTSEVNVNELEHNGGRIEALNIWLRKNGHNTKDIKKDFFILLKDNIFKNLTKTAVDESYINFIIELQKKLSTHISK